MSKFYKNEDNMRTNIISKSIITNYEKPVKKENIRNQVFYSLIIKISPKLSKEIKLAEPLDKIFGSKEELQHFVLELAKEFNVSHLVTEEELQDMNFEAFNNHYRYIWYYIYDLILAKNSNIPHSPRVTRAKVRRNISNEAKRIMTEAGVPFYDDEIPLNEIFRNEQDLMFFVLGFAQRCHTVFDPNEFTKITFQQLKTMEDLINLLEPRVLLYLSFSTPINEPPYVSYKYTKVEMLYKQMINQLGFKGKTNYDMPLAVMFKDTNSLLKFIKKFLNSFDISPTINEQQTILKYGFPLFEHSKCLMTWLTEKLIKNDKNVLH